MDLATTPRRSRTASPTLVDDRGVPVGEPAPRTLRASPRRYGPQRRCSNLSWDRLGGPMPPAGSTKTGHEHSNRYSVKVVRRTRLCRCWSSDGRGSRTVSRNPTWIARPEWSPGSTPRIGFDEWQPSTASTLIPRHPSSRVTHGAAVRGLALGGPASRRGDPHSIAVERLSHAAESLKPSNTSAGIGLRNRTVIDIGRSPCHSTTSAGPRSV